MSMSRKPSLPLPSTSTTASSTIVNAPGTSTTSTSSSSSASSPSSLQKLYPHILDLINTDKREAALLELSKKREEYPELANILWHSFGTVCALLQEIISIYPLLSPPRLTPNVSNRCCNALALLQCVASHSETRSAFLNSHLSLFLYPFLNTTCSSRQYEYLRLTSLGVIGALVKMDDPEVISFLLQTEIIPLCLRIMDSGTELSKTVATFIIQKILLDDMGLSYVCATFERFSTVSNVLSKMVAGLVSEKPSVRLLKHIVRCYLRLSDNSRARDALRACLPSQLKDNTFVDALKDDAGTKRWLAQLLYTLTEGEVSPTAASSSALSSSSTVSSTSSTTTPSHSTTPASTTNVNINAAPSRS
eukprot:TRINITY_DN3437_c0_g1_i1.p1 TRINITY_DN3437_c0_g1~~TRINITY_DN3437_c0_g1_i1.p1  ORF type:complete len:362 (+),score=76.63 TRINITY_DN3437_c0_g1_i1:57-1142(+)